MRLFGSYSFAALLITSIFAAEVVSQVQRPGPKAAFQKKGKGQPGEKNTPPARGERAFAKVKQGDEAPDFTLPTLKGDAKVTLSSFEGKKPVVLIFGSYT